MSKILRRYPVTLLFVAAIFTACLIPIPETPLSDVQFIDKWTHTVMYLALGIVFWTEYYRCRSTMRGMRLFIVAVVLPVLMGGLIEIMQATLTDCRSGEWLDFAADAVAEAARNINVDEPEKTGRKERRWFGKKKK